MSLARVLLVIQLCDSLIWSLWRIWIAWRSGASTYAVAKLVVEASKEPALREYLSKHRDGRRLLKILDETGADAATLAKDVGPLTEKWAATIYELKMIAREIQAHDERVARGEIPG